VLRVTQGNEARLTWTAPAGGADSFRVLSLSGASVDLGGATTSWSGPLPGADCFVVESVRAGVVTGQTDVVCGIGGVSTLGG
jgi:hypothetical protein